MKYKNEIDSKIKEKKKRLTRRRKKKLQINL